MTDLPIITIELTAHGNIGFKVFAAQDHIVRAYPHQVLEQLELLAQRLRDCEYPFGFLARDEEHLEGPKP